VCVCVCVCVSSLFALASIRNDVCLHVYMLYQINSIKQLTKTCLLLQPH